jgi:hypothetical protein
MLSRSYSWSRQRPRLQSPNILTKRDGPFGGVLFSSNPHGHNEEGWNSGRRRSASAGLSLRVSRECGLTPPGEIVSAACEEMNGVGQSDQREQPQVFVSVSLQVAASPAIACE